MNQGKVWSKGSGKRQDGGHTRKAGREFVPDRDGNEICFAFCKVLKVPLVRALNLVGVRDRISASTAKAPIPTPSAEEDLSSGEPFTSFHLLAAEGGAAAFSTTRC